MPLKVEIDLQLNPLYRGSYASKERTPSYGKQNSNFNKKNEGMVNTEFNSNEEVQITCVDNTYIESCSEIHLSYQHLPVIQYSGLEWRVLPIIGIFPEHSIDKDKHLTSANMLPVHVSSKEGDLCLKGTGLYKVDTLNFSKNLTSSSV